MTETKGPSPVPEAFVGPRFDPMTMFLHWATLLLVLVQFATALSIDYVDPGPARLLLTVHRSMGGALWILVAFRLGWRFTRMQLPPFPPAMPRWHVAGVHLSEYGLYALLLSQPLTGLADTLLRGHAFDLYLWRIPALLECNRDLARLAHAAHVAGAATLTGVVALHAGAALFHHFVLKDGILASMLPPPHRPTSTSTNTAASAIDWPDRLDA